MHYVWSMLVVYIKNDNTGFWEQGISLEMISAKWEAAYKHKSSITQPRGQKKS